ncbi:MAG: MTH938/NDUFAF3 family protein [Candidatus Cloacimonadales bacterium]|nr:MTH938/NDUFAF3 family protein [Candidatus Cloacimonadales bacterium]
MKIDSYSFGKIKIDGRIYDSDVIISENAVPIIWQRPDSHLLQIDDVEKILAANPTCVIIGTGFLGLMKVDAEVKSLLLKHHVKLHVEKTKRAVKIYNSYSNKENVVAALHITC